ncbi:hypothetical protein PanWU01x14_166610 [Parasponia andersonii]|uniref:Uncharacterized protein n=1 Tax=Parasponia andersonii TaxID=3476 RepID=A0A2P5CBL5_PARAD|nr:hypothetical protein PanWU01x14_166610 [Parasponia andersonii]
MITEDFSFPTGNFPSCIESPPLWHSSPAASSTDSDHQEETPKLEEEEEEEEEVVVSGASEFSCIENGQKMVKRDGKEKQDEDEDDEDDDEGEKMDLLWENFNEEGQSSSSRADSDNFERVKGGCVHQALKLSRTRNKPAMVMVLKILRKLFLLHNSHHHHHHHQNKLKSSSRSW